jgi:uncharacterized protein
MCTLIPDPQFTLDYRGLQDAVSYNNIAHIQSCIDSGLDLNHIYGYGYGLLFYAKHPESMKFLLDHGVDPHYQTHEHITALNYLAVNSDDSVDAVRILLDCSVDLNAIDDLDGRTAAHRAVQGNNVHILLELIDRGANLTIKDRNGQTPLDFAHLFNKPDCVAVLETPIKEPDDCENTPLDSNNSDSVCIVETAVKEPEQNKCTII